MALALILLVGTGLLLHSFEHLRSIALGARPSHVMTFEVNLPTGRYAAPERRDRFYREFEARLAALPGVREAAAISRLPVTRSFQLGQDGPRQRAAADAVAERVKCSRYH